MTAAAQTEGSDDGLSKEEIMAKAVEEENVQLLCRGWFGFNPSQRQAEIIGDIMFRRFERVVCTAPTRYGKTKSIAIGIAGLFIVSEGLTVNEIAPIKGQTSKFRRYLLEATAATTELDLADRHGTDARELMKEANKTHIDFINDNEINFLTAGGQNDAQGQMGEGADVVVIDESCDISDSVYQKRISRQLEESEESPWSMMIEIGNPWHKTNHFYKHWEEAESNSEHKKLHIDYEDALEEGRITQSKVDRERKELDPVWFQILYEATFPDSIENALIPHDWVERAKKNSFDFHKGDEDIQIGWGCDIAGMGNDKIVITRVLKKKERWRATHQVERAKSPDTSITAQWILDKIKYYDNPEDVTIVIDYMNMGEGVYSRLNEKGLNVVKFEAGKNPTTGKDKFRDRKAQGYWKLRSILEEDDIDISDDLPSDLTIQLTQMQLDRTSRGKRVVNDPDDSGSPDHADSLMMALALESGVQIGGIGGT